MPGPYIEGIYATQTGLANIPASLVIYPLRFKAPPPNGGSMAEQASPYGVIVDSAQIDNKLITWEPGTGTLRIKGHRRVYPGRLVRVDYVMKFTTFTTGKDAQGNTVSIPSNPVTVKGSTVEDGGAPEAFSATKMSVVSDKQASVALNTFKNITYGSFTEGTWGRSFELFAVDDAGNLKVNNWPVPSSFDAASSTLTFGPGTIKLADGTSTEIAGQVRYIAPPWGGMSPFFLGYIHPRRIDGKVPIFGALFAGD